MKWLMLKMKATLLTLIKRYNLFQVMRYGIVGICAASAHFLMAYLTHKHFGFAQTLGNVSGFLSGAIFTYLGSYYFTFKQEHDKKTNSHIQSFPRFAAVWSIGFSINVGLFQTLLSTFQIPFEINVLIAIVLTPIAQYFMFKFWAFKE